MVNKIPETDIMAQTEDQRSKTVNLNLLTPPRMGDIVLHVTADWLQTETVWELPSPILYSSLVLGIKVCTTTG